MVTNWNQANPLPVQQSVVPYQNQGQYIPLESYPVYMQGPPPENMNQLDNEEHALVEVH